MHDNLFQFHVHTVLPAKVASTGNVVTDSLEFVKYMLQYRGGGLGMQIMLLCGFASYMTHIGANNVVVKQFSKPLAVIKSPYVLLVAAYIVACLMSLAVSSATVFNFYFSHFSQERAKAHLTKIKIF